MLTSESEISVQVRFWITNICLSQSWAPSTELCVEYSIFRPVNLFSEQQRILYHFFGLSVCLGSTRLDEAFDTIVKRRQSDIIRDVQYRHCISKWFSKSRDSKEHRRSLILNDCLWVSCNTKLTAGIYSTVLVVTVARWCYGTMAWHCRPLCCSTRSGKNNNLLPVRTGWRPNIILAESQSILPPGMQCVDTFQPRIFLCST